MGLTYSSGAAVARRLVTLLTTGLALALAALVGLSGPVEAAISSPGANSTVRGDVLIHENRGGQNDWPCSGANSWIEVYNPSGNRIVNVNKGGDGSWTYRWNTHGLARGSYRLRSLTRDVDLTWRGCSTQSTVQRSSFNVTLDNRSALSAGNAATFYGEPVELRARLTDATTNRFIVGRTVRFTAGSHVLTDATDSAGYAVVQSPADLPVGSHTVAVTFPEDAAWRGSSQNVTLRVDPRPTAITLTGATAGTYGDTVDVAAKLLDTRANEPVNGGTVGFILERDGVAVRTVGARTGPDGVASTAMTLDVKGGDYVLRADFRGNAVQSASQTTAPFTVHKLASAITYTGDTRAYWSDDVTVSAEVTDVHGVALSQGSVTFSLGGDSATADVVDGLAEATLPASAEPGSHLLQAVYSGDDYYQPASSLTSFVIDRRPTVLAYDGDEGGLYGATAQLSATLTDELAEGPLDGKAVRFTIGDWYDETATTDADGRAVVTAELVDQDPGDYQLVVRFDGDDHHLGSKDGTTFTLGWQHVFADRDGRGRVYLNPATRQFQVEGPDGTSAIKHDPDMRIVGAPTSVVQPGAPEVPEPDEPSLPEPSLPEPSLPSPTVPQPPSVPDCDPTFYLQGCLPSARASAAGHEDALPATPQPGTPDLPVSPELPALPADLDVCEVAEDSECEARWVGMTYADDDLSLVGWFDTWTGAFAAVLKTESGVTPLAGTAGCVPDAAACIQPPTLPDPRELERPAPPALPEPDRPVPPSPSLPGVPLQSPATA